MFNDYFISIIKHLHIEKNGCDPKHRRRSNNPVLSGFKINFKITQAFLKSNQTELTQISISSQKIKKEKWICQNLNSFAIFLIVDVNLCIKKGEFPDKLKTTDIMLAFKEGDKHKKLSY